MRPSSQERIPVDRKGLWELERRPTGACGSIGKTAGSPSVVGNAALGDFIFDRST